MAHELYTPDGEQLTGIPWNVYPRPQLKRDSFFCLNGEWEFAETHTDALPTDYPERIRVPFAPESLLSGIHRTFRRHTRLFYRRTFSLPEGFVKARVLLHFGAVDQHATVYINGVCLGEHHGGYQPFSFDITAHLQAENTVVVCATDDLHTHVWPYGKQTEHPKGMWYTPVSGIWQTVWCESVPDTYIRFVRVETEADRVHILAHGIQNGMVTVDEITQPIVNGKATIVLNNPHLWSPEDPFLYTATLTAGEDTVETYFALRTLTTEIIAGIPRLCLNGKPYFFHGLLDQGYYSDGLFLPATPDGFAQDITAMKQLGFNTLRKHIKVEPEQFYYDCDRLGMVVFQDMVNNGDYSFLRDTALPTLGFKRRNDKLLHRETATRETFLTGMVQTVEQLYNHPCVCYWTIFNEGWGQFDGAFVYEQLQKLDTSRFIDTASGWFSGVPSDVESVHVYFKPVKLPKSEKPLVLSEFGGYSHKVNGHVYNDKEYGYRSFANREAFEKALIDLYETQIIPAVKQGLCAAVYTQVSDIEEEINGLLTYDRKMCKVSAQPMRAIAERLQYT